MTAIEAAVRNLLVAADLLASEPSIAIGERIWTNEQVPEGTKFPYLTMAPEVANPAALKGDRRTLARTRLLQVNSYQDLGTETPDLRDEIEAALDGATLAADQKVWGCAVTNVVRLEEPEDQVVHHAFDVAVTYSPTT